MTTKTIDRSTAAAALNAISSKLNGPRGEKKAQRLAEKTKRTEERKAKLLQVLTSGVTGRKDEIWNARMALIKAVSAVKNGATAKDLQACTALHKVAPWPTLVEPVTQFAEAKACPVDVLLAGLNATPAAEPKEVEAKPATASKAKPAKSNSGKGAAKAA